MCKCTIINEISIKDNHHKIYIGDVKIDYCAIRNLKETDYPFVSVNDPLKIFILDK